MSQIRLDQLKPGMVVGENTITLQGRLIFTKDTRLTRNDIKTLKAWGIPEVSILDSETTSETDELAEFDTEQVAQAEKTIESLFCKSSPDHPAIQELKRVALRNQLNLYKEQ